MVGLHYEYHYPANHSKNEVLTSSVGQEAKEILQVQENDGQAVHLICDPEVRKVDMPERSHEDTTLTIHTHTESRSIRLLSGDVLRRFW